MDLIENSLKFEHFERDFETNKIIAGELDGKIHIYITDKKDIFATPLNIAEILIRINPYHYSENIIECKGYSPNILMSSHPIFQKWSLSAKIFTDLTRSSSTLLFNVEDFQEPEFTIRLLNWMNQFFTDTILSYYNIYATLNELFSPFIDDFFPSLFVSEEMREKEITEEINEKKEAIKKNTEALISYFSEENYFRKIIYRFKDCIILGVKNLSLFSKLIDSQYQIFIEKKRWDIRNYRSTINYEKNIWRLGFHLNLINYFEDLSPMLNLNFPGPNGNLEIDIIFHNKEIFEIIECKSDIAIRFSTQESYFRKLLKKIDPLRKFLLDKGYDVKKINPSIVCDICVAKPPNVIDVFLSEIHFFENFSRKYGLYKWNGSTFFEIYPIIARIGWESLIHGIKPKIDLKYLIPTSNLILIKGEIENKNIKLMNEMGEDKIIADLELNLNNKMNWNGLPILIIWNNENQSIKDYLILPPYWEQIQNDNGFFGKSIYFHNTEYGQKYLHVAIKNGVFGYCEECKIFPLVPTGKQYKTMQYSAKGICPNCDKSYNIYQYDLASFSENKELLASIKESFRLRYEI